MRQKIDSKELNDYKEKHDIMVFVNTMKLNDNTKLFGSLDDEKVLFNSPDEVWGTMINLGVNAIQTDWPDILYRFRENKFKNEQ